MKKVWIGLALLSTLTLAACPATGPTLPGGGTPGTGTGSTAIGANATKQDIINFLNCAYSKAPAAEKAKLQDSINAINGINDQAWATYWAMFPKAAFQQWATLYGC